ncbi:protein of unknown function DUF1555 [Rippkaea orientalis PCC 8801]|uniref:PEP-CTERM protein-sorting domain-containing protein n=1 Tax=Rippkaea orientalis (strain PCC 8801 / RF-1) TaxID=41431 RepID=B7K438_RIPO1|nr:PEP-CTERM domain protein [Rippkaea orientalis]ACK67744.1 protein of unknown function DUF1555 [Rippkaea orientalis PCC 8801]
MSSFVRISQTTILALACFLCFGTAEKAESFTFNTVVNNEDLVPETNRLFNSYNPPSVNNNGVVVFRARSQGGSGQPATGVFTRDMASLNADIIPIITRGMEVPEPNNTTPDPTFTEFPSFPRIDQDSNRVASRGQSNPVWQLPDDTRLGTSGIYTDETGTVITGVSQLGAIAGFELFSVPGTTPGTKFDQFPGSPSVTNGDTLVFKGNWTDENLIPQTGVYFRNVVENGGLSPVELIADSNTLIPGTTTEFGSTAPPSAADGQVVFVGVDNEATPTLGGIYLSSLDDPTNLQSLVSIGGLGDLINDPDGLKSIGEGLSFDGNSVAFWGGWGTDFFTQTVICPEEGNQERLQYCRDQSPNGDGIYQFDVLSNQGIFVTDLDTNETQLIAQTGTDFSTFVFWNFSGRVPGSENEEDGELARWRSSAFIALSGEQVAFKATTGPDAETGEDGIYIQLGPDLPITTVVETGMDGSVLDPIAAGLPITSLSIEREGLRNGWLAIAASMGNEEASWAGIYITRTVPEPSSVVALLGLAIAGLGATLAKPK